MSAEPILDAHDRAVWARWMIVADRHARTGAHRRRVDQARRLVDRCLEEAGGDAVVMWSAGKDSTVMAHLITAATDARLPLVSEKDDLDYPGEETYVTELAREWGAPLEIVHPPISPAEWIREHAYQLDVAGDFHSRAAGLSKACFYEVVEAANREREAIFLGLRSAESPGRTRNRRFNGLLYRRSPAGVREPGQLVCTPLGDWEGIDVYAYAITHGIELLPVYRCVGFMHAREPWRVRKSWWIPGGSSAMGGVAWLRRYWPTLYRQLREWIPLAQSYA
ncbi:MAG TPA: phosphoadenosine phosphosulfate reductase family protein [Longimicrobiales bacterium]